MPDDNRVNREDGETVKEENLSVADTRIPLAALGMRMPTLEQYRESCKGMEESYGARWRETFAELRESEKQIAELKHEKAKLQAKVTRLESERNLLALETGQHWKN